MWPMQRSLPKHLSYAKAMTYEQLLQQAVENDPRVMVVTAENRAAIRNLPPKINGNFLDVGIAEQTMIGMCAGLALRGRIPVAHALATFLTLRAYEFIRTDVGIPSLPVKLVGGVPGFLSEANGPTHQAIEDVALLRQIPGMRVFCPADEADLLAMMPEILRGEWPAYIRYTNRPAVVSHSDFVVGKAEVVADGGDVVILTYGLLLEQALEARQILSSEGISARVVNMRTLSPVDEECIRSAARSFRLMVTLEDHFAVGGLATIASEVLTAAGLFTRLLPIALNKKWFAPHLLAGVLKVEGFTGADIARTISSALVHSTPKKHSDMPAIQRSQELWERGKALIPSGTQTLAKGPTQHSAGVAPIYAKRGMGSKLQDVDGNVFLDYTMGVGPLVLGYGWPAVDAAIRAQLADGITFSLMHELEVTAAERFCSVVPYAEAVRFSKTGADVTSAAVRLARRFTGRSKVVCCGYHGWHDWYVATTPRNGGIPEPVRSLTASFSYNSIESLEAVLDDDVAAVILEPMIFEYPKEGFLESVRSLCDKHGALLIFDEMWTGFRLALGGAQEYFGVRADMATFSKAVANGMPVSVLSGRAEVLSLLDDDVFFFTTFGGEALSLAALVATIDELERHDVASHLENRGEALRSGIHSAAASAGLGGVIRCVGYPARTMLTFAGSPEEGLIYKTFVQQELIRRGILWSGSHNLSFSHSEADIERTVAAYAEVFRLLAAYPSAAAVATACDGAILQPVFRKTKY